MLAAATVTVILAAMPIDAAAKPSQKVVTATIAGKRFRPTRRLVQLTANGGTIGFSALGQKLARPGGTIKTLYVACAVLLTGRTFPFTSTDCLTNYSETKVSRHPSMKIWSDIVIGQTAVTFDSYDGTQIAGSFHAVVPAGPSNPGLPTITVDGAFHGPFQQGNPNR